MFAGRSEFFRFASTAWAIGRCDTASGAHHLWPPRLDDPCTVALDEHTVAGEFVEVVIVTRQCLDDDLARIAQHRDAGAQRLVMPPRGKDRTTARLSRQ